MAVEATPLTVTTPGVESHHIHVHVHMDARIRGLNNPIQVAIHLNLGVGGQGLSDLGNSVSIAQEDRIREDDQHQQPTLVQRPPPADARLASFRHGVDCMLHGIGWTLVLVCQIVRYIPAWIWLFGAGVFWFGWIM